MWAAIASIIAAIITSLAELFIREAQKPTIVEKSAPPDPALADYLDARVQEFGDGRGAGSSDSTRP